MKINLFIFLVICLFMIHEFEEIIFVKPWIDNKSTTEQYSNEMWIKNKEAYPSAEIIALIIFEEFILLFCIFLIASLTKFYELAVGVTIAHTLHLIILHLINTIRFCVFSPGIITSIITLPLLILIIILYCRKNKISWIKLCICTLASSIIVLVNLRLLYKIAPLLDNWLNNFYKV